MINLTPHAITVTNLGTFAPSGELARVSMHEEVIKNLDGVPVIRRTPNLVTGIPRDSNGVPLPCIVSSMVLDALPEGTKNVYAPDTGPTAIRENGQVVAVTRLVCKG